MFVKNHVHTLLPIALALILPGLGLYTYTGLSAQKLTFLQSWVAVSSLLYLLWHLLMRTWRLEVWARLLAYVLIALLQGCIIFGAAHLFGSQHQRELQDFLLPSALLIRVVLAQVLFLSIQYAFKTQEHIAGLLLEREQIQTENFRMQLNALRAQIDPHFLFNSLNTLRAMVHQQDSNAEQFVISLADFYRQTLKNHQHHTAPLSEELQLLSSYLFLMENRHGAAMRIAFSIDPALNAYHLPTMALQMVVENCFKHNSMTARMPLCVVIETTGDLHIQVRNNLQPKFGQQESSGFGLALLKKRYALMKADPGVSIGKTDTHFVARLKLIP